MGYVNAAFYKSTYHGDSIPDDILEEVLDRASLDIDTITRMRIHQLGGFDRLSDFEKVRVQLAVCSQAEHLYEKSSLEGVSSYNIGDVSVGLEKSFDLYDARCMAYLNATRLTYRGL